MLSFEVMFLGILGLIWIIFATIQDLKKREVANWLNFSLIIFALGIRFFYSLFSENFNFFYQGMIGLFIFFILGNLFYYGRIFAGGDAKLMIALGAILPINYIFLENVKIFVLFIFLFFFIGAFYGLFISLFLMIKNFKLFRKEFKKQFNKHKKLLLISSAVGIIFLGFSFFYELFFIFGLLVFFLPYFYLIAKSIDEACMIKYIDTKKLTEGDWLYKDISVGKNLIKSDWEGLTKKEIKQIQKKYRKVKIRQGIAFVPVFLVSYIILLGLIYFRIIEKLWGFWF